MDVAKKAQVVAPTESAATLNAATGGSSWTARFAIPCLIFGCAVTAFSPVLVRISEIGPIATAADRVMLSLPVYAFLWARQGPARAIGSTDLWLLLLAGAIFGTNLMCWHLAIHLTSIANATLLSNMSPVVVVTLSWLVFHERIRPLFATGLVCAVGGVGLLVGDSLKISIASLLGDLAGFASAFFYGIYILIIARLRHRLSATTVLAIGTVTASATLLVAAFVAEGRVWPTTLQGWSIVLTLAVVVQLIGQTLIAAAIAHVTASLAALIMMTPAAFSLLLGWIFFREPVSLLQTAGAIAIFFGIELGRRSTRSAPTRANATE
jgi:drug/metabolite transporter (DMT)-like permease